jgi:hypothetical protein
LERLRSSVIAAGLADGDHFRSDETDFRPIQCFPQSLKSVRIIAFVFFLYRNVFLGSIWNSVSIPNRYSLCGSSRFLVFAGRCFYEKG